MKRIRLLILLSLLIPANTILSATESINPDPHQVRISISTKEVSAERVRIELLRIVAAYESAGFLSVSVQVLGLDTIDHQVQFMVQVVPGPISRLVRFEVNGLSADGERQVRRMLQSDSNMTLDSDLKTRLENRSDRLLTWTRKELPIFRADASPENITALLQYRPRPPLGFRAQGGIGLGSEVVLDGSAGLTIRRIGSWDDQLQLLVSRTKQERQIQPTYKSSITLLGLSRLTIGLHSRERVDEFTEFRGTAGIESFVSDQTQFGAAVSISRLDDNDPRLSFTRSTLRLYGGMETASRSRGSSVSYKWQVDYLSRSYTTADPTRTQRTSDAVQGNLSLRNRFQISSSYFLRSTAKIEIRNLDRLTIPQSELIPIGGMHSLRGYRDEQFFVQNAVTLQIEPTIQLRSSSMYLFADIGFLEIPVGVASSSNALEIVKRFEYSYGLGLRLSDTRRLLEFGLGWGRDIPLGEPRLFVELSESL